jgi:3-oxoacyl-[acyl-carrier-protein] synthase-3
MNTVSLMDVASYLPENRVDAAYFAQFAKWDAMARSMMFSAPRTRHHVGKDETVVDIAERAVAPLIERHGGQAIRAVDVLLTHTQLPDNPMLGAGPEIARRLGLQPGWVFDVHNSGCAAFVQMMMMARMVLQSTDAKTALLITTSNVAGQACTQTEVRGLPLAAVPGDGCGVGLLAKTGTAPILDIECRTFPEYAGDMEFTTNSSRKYWEPGDGQPCINFTESKVAKVFTRGNRLVPEVALAVCDRLGVRGSDVDMFVTNQPNRLFLRNWTEALQLTPERHPDTYDECGNLFAAGIPVTLDMCNSAGRIPNGALVLMSAFAHAGDFAGAAAVRWGAAR